MVALRREVDAGRLSMRTVVDRGKRMGMAGAARASDKSYVLEDGGGPVMDLPSEDNS